jgi:hypothetical protein
MSKKKTTKKVVKKGKKGTKHHHVAPGKGKTIMYKGKPHTCLQLARALGCSVSVVYTRVNKGLSDKEIVEGCINSRPRPGYKAANSAAPLTVQGVAQALVGGSTIPPAGLLKMIALLSKMKSLSDADFRRAVRELL